MHDISVRQVSRSDPSFIVKYTIPGKMKHKTDTLTKVKIIFAKSLKLRKTITLSILALVIIAADMKAKNTTTEISAMAPDLYRTYNTNGIIINMPFTVNW